MLSQIGDKRSGIYRIINTLTGNYYIGSAIRFSQRRREHRSLLNRGKHHSIVLQRAYNKHGIEVLKFEVLAICPPEYLIKLEQWFLDNLKPKYNCCKKAGSMFGYKFSRERCREISLRNMGRTSPNKGKKYSEDFKIKLSEAHSHERKPVYSFTLTGEFVKKYNSRKEAVLEGFDYGNISRVIKGKSKSHKGLLWKNNLN